MAQLALLGRGGSSTQGVFTPSLRRFPSSANMRDVKRYSSHYTPSTRYLENVDDIHRELAAVCPRDSHLFNGTGGTSSRTRLDHTSGTKLRYRPVALSHQSLECRLVIVGCKRQHAILPFPPASRSGSICERQYVRPAALLMP